MAQLVLTSGQVLHADREDISSYHGGLMLARCWSDEQAREAGDPPRKVWVPHAAIEHLEFGAAE